MLPSDIEKAVRSCDRRYGVLGLSAFAADVPDLDSLLRRVPEPDRWSSLGVSRADVLLRAGFRLLPTFDAPHYTILPDLSGGTVNALRTSFRAEQNPLFRPRRRRAC